MMKVLKGTVSKTAEPFEIKSQKLKDIHGLKIGLEMQYKH